LATSYISPPVVKSIITRNYIGTVGDKIAVRAIDDFRVVSVRIEIYAANGKLEEGDAEQNANGLDWNYTASQANAVLAGTRIKGIATDVPGNDGILVVSL